MTVAKRITSHHVVSIEELSGSTTSAFITSYADAERGLKRLECITTVGIVSTVYFRVWHGTHCVHRGTSFREAVEHYNEVRL